MRNGTLIASLLAVLVCAPAFANDTGVSHLMRFADIHEGTIVFTYEDDLWRLEREQAAARRLTRHPGLEAEAHFSPDGERLAFTAEYDGGVDVYVMDANGSPPVRLTWHPARDRALGWTPDGREVLFRSDRTYPFRGTELYAVSPTGGLPRRLPVDRAGLASLSPNGARLAYNRISREERTWKRHKGGTAQNIWIGQLDQGDFREVTEWEGTDSYPMWIGDEVYFTSDRRFGTLNLYALDVASGEIRPVTAFRDYDVKYPSEGPGEIVFQYGESLHVLDVTSGEVRQREVRVHSDRVPVRAEYVSVGENVDSFRLSPDGSELLLSDRGEVLRIPVDEGEPIRVTDTSASREKHAVFSPDGERLAFLSDASGEEQVWIVGKDERFAPSADKPLTDQGQGYRMELVWGPRSDHLLFADKFMKLWLVDADTGKMTLVDQGEYDDGWYRWGIQDYRFSPDGRFVVYTKMERSLSESLFLYEVDSAQTHRITGPETTDWSPSFDPKGRYLYFLSSRTFDPVMGQIDQNHVFLDTVRAYLVLLDAEAPSPFGPAGELAPAEDADAAEEPGDQTVSIDVKGLGERVLAVEGLEPGRYFRLEATEAGFLVLEQERRPFLKYQQVDDRSSGELDLLGYELEEASARTLIDGISNYHLSHDRAKLVYRSGDTFGVVDAGHQAQVGDGRIDLGGVRMKIDRLAEFEQIFHEAWRVQRDWFYDPEMHGVSWEVIREKYRRFVDDCGDRGDLNYLIGEMIGELNAGHTYIFGGDLDRHGERVPVGLLGCDFAADTDAGFHRIEHIVPGTSWDPSERSPLEEPGCGIEAGDYLIAIDRQKVSAGDNPLRHLEGKVGEVVEISYNDAPAAEGAETCRIEPIGSERGIRYRQWVEHNRRHVEARSRGRIAYVHVPNMMQGGLIEFARAFYPNYFAEGMIIDDRYNTGGFVGDMIIDRLEREVWSMTKPREGLPIPNPERGFRGHLAVLVNHDTGSNGEYFAEAIKIKGLAPIIGERTWGGAIGIEPHQDLVDGAVTTPPQFAPYGLDGRWLIEGRGVEPDLRVAHPPSAALAGEDPQLDAAIDLLLRKIEEEPKAEPAPPAYPVKAKP